VSFQVWSPEHCLLSERYLSACDRLAVKSRLLGEPCATFSGGVLRWAVLGELSCAFVQKPANTLLVVSLVVNVCSHAFSILWAGVVSMVVVAFRCLCVWVL
jgi:hypothetical protein